MYATEMINTNAVRIFRFLGYRGVDVCDWIICFGLPQYFEEDERDRRAKNIAYIGGNIARVINAEFFIIIQVASLMGSGLGYLMIDKMMDAIWEYYQPVNFVTLGICVALLFVVATITVAYKTIVTALINPVNTLREP